MTVQSPRMLHDPPSFGPQPSPAPSHHDSAKHVPIWAINAVLAACVAVFLVLLTALPNTIPGAPVRAGLVGVAIAILFLDLICVGIIVANRGSLRAFRPHQIRQPIVPAGAQGRGALDCPNCRAPPKDVDRFGGATCTHCGTRFRVR